MDISTIATKAKKQIFRFRYPILVVLVGLVLLTIPSKNKTSVLDSTIPVHTQNVLVDPASELTDILSQIKGVGRVKLLLTISKGEKKEYQMDENQSINETGSSVHKETVIIRDANDNESALITQVIPAEYMGAIVVCEGADDPNVKLAVLEAVAKATGLRSDKISVLKMK